MNIFEITFVLCLLKVSAGKASRICLLGGFPSQKNNIKYCTPKATICDPQSIKHDISYSVHVNCTRVPDWTVCCSSSAWTQRKGHCCNIIKICPKFVTKKFKYGIM